MRSPARRVAAIVKSPRSGSAASQTSTCDCASVGDDAGVGLGVVGRGDGERGIVEVARRVTALGKASLRRRERARASLADSLGNDKNRKAGRNKRLGFTRGDAASADDYGSTTVRPQRNGEHTQCTKSSATGGQKPPFVLRSPLVSAPARAALVGALAAALITLPGLGGGTLWDNSETAYGEVAREILLTHDWVVMHLNGVP